MSKRVIILAAAFGAALAGCASDVVMKPAVNEFVADSNSASESVTKSYQELIADTNKATAMLLASNSECGMNIRIMMRKAEMDRLLRSPAARTAARAEARRRGIKLPKMPQDSYCLTDFERVVLENAYPNSTALSSTRLRILDASDFKPQLDTVKVLTEYVGVLADLADEPKLEVKDRIDSIAKTVRGIGGDALTIGAALGVINAERNTEISGWVSDEGEIHQYATALGGLAGTLENIARQDQDVRALRARLLDPDNNIRETILQIGKEADDWSNQHRLVRQSLVSSMKRGVEPELAQMTFQDRTEAFSTYLQQYSGADPARAAKSPYGAMMVALAEAHDDLQRIARGKYTREEKRRMSAETLKRLGAVLKGIAGIATVFL